MGGEDGHEAGAAGDEDVFAVGERVEFGRPGEYRCGLPDPGIEEVAGSGGDIVAVVWALAFRGRGLWG